MSSTGWRRRHALRRRAPMPPITRPRPGWRVWAALPMCCRTCGRGRRSIKSSSAGGRTPCSKARRRRRTRSRRSRPRRRRWSTRRTNKRRAFSRRHVGRPPAPAPMIAFARKHAWSYFFIAPTLAFFVLFTLVPVIEALALSLQNATIVGGTFVGLENFVTLARDPIFLKAVGNTILYALIVVAAQIALALLIAGLLQPLPAGGQVFYCALRYLPLANSASLVALVWRSV